MYDALFWRYFLSTKTKLKYKKYIAFFSSYLNVSFRFRFQFFNVWCLYFDDIFWALKQNLQKKYCFFSSYLNVSFRFRFFHDALFWRYFFFFNKFQHYEFEFSRIFRTIRTNPGYFLFIIFSSYVDVSFRFRFSNALQVNNFQKVSFVYHFIEKILQDSASVWNNLSNVW